uniref:Uncharacterized protein n=1 Tax=Babesia bovis TaxID=5865 RepID=S6CAR9_BABBO|nr:hypothetical protein [Babesia bovis]
MLIVRVLVDFVLFSCRHVLLFLLSGGECRIGYRFIFKLVGVIVNGFLCLAVGGLIGAVYQLASSWSPWFLHLLSYA